MRLIVLGLVACTVVVTATAGIAMLAVLMRDPASPPIATRMPDLAFFVPGVESLVEWEAGREARREFQAHQPLLLGYKHGRNVGELSGCIVESYEVGAGRPDDMPAWIGRAALGMMSVRCRGPRESGSYQFTVLECGNPFDAYQVIYGRAFNEETLRLTKLHGIRS